MNTAKKKNASLARAAALALLAALCICQLAQARFRQPNAEYQARRAKVRATIDAPLVIFGYTGHEDASEVAVFYQEPYFYYLTGHDEPGAALVLLPAAPNSKPSDAPQEILYLPARNLDEEKWEGPKMGPNDPGIAQKTGFQA
ncbi:MAG: aminopeptidase P N-terminal domain-containing protein, partial [Candidatus Acidiferrales bacterium]